MIGPYMCRIRQVVACLLILLGIAMVARGAGWSARGGLGWQGFVQSLVVGGLVFALGVARWRYWRRR